MLSMYARNSMPRYIYPLGIHAHVTEDMLMNSCIVQNTQKLETQLPMNSRLQINGVFSEIL